MKGTVQIIFKSEVVQQLNYKCETDLNNFLEKWERLYGKKFKECSIVNVPDIKSSRLWTGFNKPIHNVPPDSTRTKVCRNPKCPHLGNPQPESDFYRNRAHIDSLSNNCKDCDRTYAKAREQRHMADQTGFFNMLIGGKK
jgi:hypothetical protein